MTFRQFAFNNVKRNARQYLSYFLSCMFSVTVFFIYAVLMFHPDIQEYDFMDTVQQGITFAEMIIFGFSFLFVLYSTGSFVKSRKKEYGLLTTLGISKRQLNRMLIIENTLIGLASIVAGLLLGALFAKIFIMGFSELLGLQDPLSFRIAPTAILLTAGLYFVMFELNSLFVVWTLRTNSIMELFRGSKAPKKQPKFSWILSILAILLIGAAYYLAWIADLLSIFYLMGPILLLIIPGTYLLFTQFSIAFTTILKRKKSFYFKQTNLVTISDIAYKLKDHARLLFLVTILSAVAFTSSGVLFGLFKSAETEAEFYIPQDVSLISRGLENDEAMAQEINQVETAFDEAGISFDSVLIETTKAMTAASEEEFFQVHLMAHSDYLRLVELNGLEPEAIPAGEALLLAPNDAISLGQTYPDQLKVASRNKKQTFTIDYVPSITNPSIFTRHMLVVDDASFQAFQAVEEPLEHHQYYAMDIPRWILHAEKIDEIVAEVDREVAHADTPADFYLMMKETMSYTFFFGVFISVLFFLAAGSILYFRMYQDIDKDLHQYKSLYRIGLTVKEMRRIASRELSFLFFIPFAVAVVHAGFAFKALQNVLSASVLLPSIIIIGSFFVVHSLYFLFIRSIYTAKLRKVMQ